MNVRWRSSTPCSRRSKRPTAWDHPPRHQAAEHHDHAVRAGEGARFRSGQAHQGMRRGFEGRPMERSSCRTPIHHTDVGEAAGTARYMAPEQARGEQDLDERCDIFAAGAVLFECLTGRPAFGAAGFRDKLACRCMSVRCHRPRPWRQGYLRSSTRLWRRHWRKCGRIDMGARRRCAMRCLGGDPGNRSGARLGN